MKKPLKTYFKYQCRLCKTEFNVLYENERWKRSDAKFLEKVLSNKTHTVHECDLYRKGVADLLGMIKTVEDLT